MGFGLSWNSRLLFMSCMATFFDCGAFRMILAKGGGGGGRAERAIAVIADIARHPTPEAKSGLSGDPGYRRDRKTKDQNLERNFLYVVGKSSGITRVSPTALMKFTSPNQRGRMCMWM